MIAPKNMMRVYKNWDWIPQKFKESILCLIVLMIYKTKKRKLKMN